MSNHYNQYLGFGCASITSVNSYTKAIKLLDTAFNLGIRHFDTAPLYGQGYAEKILGDFIKSKREKLTITTKFGLGYQNKIQIPATIALPLNYYRKRLKKPIANRPESNQPVQLSFRKITLEEIKESLAKSLKRLQTNYIDYFFLHEGLPSFLNKEASDFLMNLKEDGVVKYLGIATNSVNLRNLKKEEAAGWDVLQYEAVHQGCKNEIKELFPDKTHFFHSCLKDLSESPSIKDIPSEDIGGYKLAECVKQNNVEKVLFQTRRLKVLSANILSFNKYVK